MNEHAREVLRNLIAERGTALARDRVRLGGFLRDECGEAKREINLLLDAIDERVIEDLLAQSDEPIDVILARLTQRFVANRGTNAEAANWAVVSWAIALGKYDPHQRTNAGHFVERHIDDRPIEPPAPAPVPPGPGIIEQALRVFRTPAGRPRWLPIGVAVAIAAALLTNPFGDDKTPRIVRVELANTVFDGSTEVRAKLIGDGRRYPARIWFEDKDGDLRSLLIKNLGGVWANGNDTNTRAVNLPGRTSGSIDTETFSYTGTGGVRISLVLVDAAGRNSKPFVFQYDADAPPKPAAAAVPSGRPAPVQPATQQTAQPAGQQGAQQGGQQGGTQIHIPQFRIPPINVPNPFRK